jgi:hypothetical protein
MFQEEKFSLFYHLNFFVTKPQLTGLVTGADAVRIVHLDHKIVLLPAVLQLLPAPFNSIVRAPRHGDYSAPGGKHWH